MSRSLTEVSRLKGRVTERRNLMMVDGDEETWRRLDQKVNTYPREAEFTAIGSGGADFKAAMVAAVEAVVGSLHSECVSERQSTEGRYISVRLSCHVATADDVIKIYENMRSDARLQFFI